MAYRQSKIWTRLKDVCDDTVELANIEKTCDSAIELLKTVRDTFPTFTLHDEKHVDNVIWLMEQILGDSGVANLSAGECAMLILSACYHDVGMCYTQEQRKRELKSARFAQYLEKNPRSYLEVERSKESGGEIPEQIQSDYFRKIHHLRVNEFLSEDWKSRFVRRDMLIEICKSHGENIKNMIDRLQCHSFAETDYVLCAVLLRLADIMDFDASRAPEVLYQFQGIAAAPDIVADIEWKKHRSSDGFKFIEGKERILAYAASCESLQEEYEIKKFLDYIDEELETCGQILKIYVQKKWEGIQIPTKIDRQIERRGYQAGEYCLSLQADNVIDLLVGDDLYRSDSTFIRELLQNAMDAVRARRMADHRWDEREDNRITISSWFDAKGFQWFRIDDCGIGMTEQMIKEYFLRVGNSYYRSDEFKKLKYENKRFYDFSPISNFGIGILSCFLKGDRMEISTRHYDSGKGIRFAMNGMKGYYSIAEEEKGDRGTPMPCAFLGETENFRQRAGTSIAIRIKESLSDNVLDSLKKYVCYSDTDICYRNGIDTVEFVTEQELMEFAKRVRNIKIPFPKELTDQIKREMPQIEWEEEPYIFVNCVPLDEISIDPAVSGVDFEINIQGAHSEIQPVIIDEAEINCELILNLAVMKKEITVSAYYQIMCYEGHHPTALMDLQRRYGDRDELTELARMDEVRVEADIPFTIHPDLKIMMEKFILPRCDSGRQYIDNHKTEKVYDGICVETSWEHFSTVENRDFRYTALLLSKEFQPKLGVSREYVKYFPIRAAACIELLGKKIYNGSFSCEYPSYYRKMELEKFMDLMNDPQFRQAAEEILQVKWNLSIAQLREQINCAKGGVNVHLTSFETIFGDSFGECEFYFSRIMLRALLQKEFEICWEFNEHGAREYFVTGIRRDQISEAEKKLLPLTFVHSSDNNMEILTESNAIGRCALNADHPFAVWITRNAAYFEEKHRGLWNRLREAICILEASKMITEVNMLLAEIGRREQISIPEEVRLKQSDFLE